MRVIVGEGRSSTGKGLLGASFTIDQIAGFECRERKVVEQRITRIVDDHGCTTT
jgi:hypothetical protein